MMSSIPKPNANAVQKTVKETVQQVSQTVAQKAVQGAAALSSVGNALDEVANRFQALVDRAVPTANRLATVIRVGGFLGLIGGVIGAAALSMPGFGFFRSWPWFVFLLFVAVLASMIVFRWAKHLRAWSGDVTKAVQRLHDIPSPGQLLEHLQANASAAGQHLAKGNATGGRASIVQLVRSAKDLRKRVKDIPGAADKAKDLLVELTGPFRPPMLGLRFSLLIGGLMMIVVGPILALIAAAT